MFYPNYKDPTLVEYHIEDWYQFISTAKLEEAIKAVQEGIYTADILDIFSDALTKYNYYCSRKELLRAQRPLPGINYSQIKGELDQNCEQTIYTFYWLIERKDEKIVDLLLEFVYTSLAITKKGESDDLAFSAVSVLLTIDPTDKQFVSLFIHLLKFADFEPIILLKIIVRQIKNIIQSGEKPPNFLIEELNKAGFSTDENSIQVEPNTFPDY